MTSGITYWHVAGADYSVGDDLLSFARRYERGDVSLADWRWEHDYGTRNDHAEVSLWATREEAMAWLSEHGGQLVRVDGGLIRVHTAEEGHPAAWDEIPAAACALEKS